MKKIVAAVNLFVIAFVATSCDGAVDLPEHLDLPYNGSPNLFFDLQNLNLTEIEIAIRAEHPHSYLTVIELIELYEYKTETHMVETYDGYLLELHRITGNKHNPSPQGKPVAFVQHGLLSSSMDWVIAGPERGLGFILADAGYDVWLGNTRGNKFCRNHTDLNPSEGNFWTFSWHEMGTRDLPAMIDYVLDVTGQKNLFYIGHSQGTTAFFVMASELPKYNDKIKTMFALAPISFSSRMFSPVLQALSKLVTPLNELAKLIGMHEFNPTNEFFKKFTTLACQEGSIFQRLCMNVLFIIAGFNKNQMDLELLPAILSHIPAGSSTKQFAHYGQLIKSGHFRQFDLGLKGNLKQYKRRTPPSYKIEKITAPVILHYSANDWLSHINDVQSLGSKLPNSRKLRLPDGKFNHLDYMWAKDAKPLLYCKILSLMSRQEGAGKNCENLKENHF